MTRLAPGEAVPAAPSLREAAGTRAPESPAATAAAPHFEKRSAPAPEIPGISAWVQKMNQDLPPPEAVVMELRSAKNFFSLLVQRGLQTRHTDGKRTSSIIPFILASENARHPGLNAVVCHDEFKMKDCLKQLSEKGGHGHEGHVRFHLGINGDIHRIAVDAFRHREGGFTLIAVDSIPSSTVEKTLAGLQERHPDLIKGGLALPTNIQAHEEGCRMFAVHALNALHDFQPYVQSLHREIHDFGRGNPWFRNPSRDSHMPLLDGTAAVRIADNTHVLRHKLEAFGVLPAKFFKHIQDRTLKPLPGKMHTMLDEAEDRNPLFRDQAVNKKGQTLRERFASLNPAKPTEEFSCAEKSLSIDRKRLVYIDRAIAHFESLA